MLGIDLEASRAEMLDDLKKRAESLLSSLSAGDFSAAATAIQDINEARDRSLYREVGKLTRGLHRAIRDFNIDMEGAGIPDDTKSEMANAQDRLGYVLAKTQAAADKTMDMVEAGIPLAHQLGEEATLLKADWERLIRREMNPDEFRVLYRRVDEFLGRTQQSATTFGDHFNSILMAQDYQDLTGQVIKKVIALVEEVELNLVSLMRIAGTVEELTGIVAADVPIAPVGPDVGAEGPVVNNEQRADVVKGQDDVDDLLSSLGF